MSKGLVDLVLQVAMVGGLLAVLVLLLAPVFNVLGFGDRARSLVPNKHVLEVKDDKSETRRLLVGRIKSLLEQRGNKPDIEVVAVKDGVDLFVSDSVYVRQLEALMLQGVKFSACQRAIDAMTRKIGDFRLLMAGVHIVKDGHMYAEQLKDNGYTDEFA